MRINGCPFDSATARRSGASASLALPFSICVAVGGGVWAWIYHKSGSLYAAWVSHAMIDTAILLVGFDMIQPYLGPLF